MGTRSCTVVFDYHGKPIISMYRQFDGYFEGHGQELADFLANLTLINGMSGDTTNQANGPGCLAAQVVAHFKNKHGVGGIYLYPPDDDNSQGYNYSVHCDSPEGLLLGTIRLVASSLGEQHFEGPPSEFDGAALNRAANEEEEVDEEEEKRQAALAKLSPEDKKALKVS